MRILVTGGAGFIGSAVVRRLIEATGHSVLNIDKLTYAASPGVARVGRSATHATRFARIDICDKPAVASAFRDFRPDAVMHLAAESHVDRSIDGPEAFVETNTVGTLRLLEAARAYWAGLDKASQARFRFHHISTDEVFGALVARRPALLRDHSLRSALTLFGQQGCGRSSRPRLGSHLRPAGPGDQLHQQLRPLPFSRKAHPADDHQGAEGRAPPRLRTRRERPRLAARGGPRGGARRGGGARPRRRDLSHRRRRGTLEPRRRDAASHDWSTRWRSRFRTVAAGRT